MRSFKNKKIFLSVIVIFGIFNFLTYGESLIYSNMALNQGMLFIGEESFISSTNIALNLGYMKKKSDRNSYLCLYQLVYQGPGLRPLDVESYLERSQDHYFLFKYIRKVNEKFRFKFRANYLAEFFRLSKSENWGSGLYDMNRTGIGLELESTLKNGNKLEIIYNNYTSDYPNYSNLFIEYITDGTYSDLEMGNTSHDIEFRSKVKRGLITKRPAQTSIKLNFRDYDKHYVLSEQGVNSNTTQQDKSYIMSYKAFFASESQPLQLELIMNIFDSNQNYFQYGADNVQFFLDYFDHTQYIVKFAKQFNKLKIFNKPGILAFAYSVKDYNRPALDNSGADKGKNLTTNSYIFTCLIEYYRDRYFSVRPMFTVKSSTSNTDYEKTFSYNYTIYYFGLNIEFEY